MEKFQTMNKGLLDTQYKQEADTQRIESSIRSLEDRFGSWEDRFAKEMEQFRQIMMQQFREMKNQNQDSAQAPPQAPETDFGGTQQNLSDAQDIASFGFGSEAKVANDDGSRW